MIRLGHQFSKIISFVIFILLLSVWISMDLGTRMILSSILAGAVLISWITLRKHNRGFCDQCLTPLQPAQEAVKYRQRLNITHKFSDGVEYLITFTVTMVLLTTMAISYPYPVIIGLWEIGQLAFVYLLICNVTHTRLAPWCPKCRNGGQELKESPDNDPVGLGV